MLHRLLPCLLLAMATLFFAPGVVMGQGDDSTTPAAGAEDQAVSGVASRFLISRKTGGGIEILGTFIIWLLIVLSMLGIGLIGMMVLTNQRKSILPPAVVAEARQLIATGKFRELLTLSENEPSYFSQVLHGALKESSHGFSAMIRALEQTSDELTTIRLRRVEYLNVLGQVSPMIGLFGTVYGMILAFQAIVATGGNADPVALAGGISTALTTTFWGLVVAIPALAGYAIVRNKIDELTTEATLVAEELCNQFRPKPKSASRSESRGSGSGSKSAPKPDVTHAGS